MPQTLPTLARRGLVLACCLAVTACGSLSLPFVSGRYLVADPATGTDYCASRIRREKGGIVEFRNASTGSWMSVPGATVVELSAADYASCLAR